MKYTEAIEYIKTQPMFTNWVEEKTMKRHITAKQLEKMVAEGILVERKAECIQWNWNSYCSVTYYKVK